MDEEDTTEWFKISKGAITWQTRSSFPLPLSLVLRTFFPLSIPQCLETVSSSRGALRARDA